jgi:hypothetical protein
MSEVPQGPAWWQATDGKWYPPQPPPTYVPVPQPTTNGYAIASLVLGIVWIYGITSILALVFGYRARREIDASQGWQTGRGLATAGIVLGWVGVGGLILVVVIIIIAIAASPSSTETGLAAISGSVR